jgi:HK97 family phage portal protein
VAGRLKRVLSTALRSLLIRVERPIGHGAVVRDIDGIWVPSYSSPFTMADSLIQPYAQHATVYKAVTIIARNIASVKLEFFKGDSDEALPPTDPIVALFSNPEKRSGLRQRQFVMKHAQDMELSGDWFIEFGEFARGGKGRSEIPTTMRRLPRSRMRPDIEPNTGAMRGWIYQPPVGAARHLPDEKIMHSFYPSPYDDLMGMAPMSAALLDADSDYQAAMWNRYFFENDTSSGVVFKRDKDTYSDPEKDREFLEWWKQKRAGVSRSHTAILPPPGTDVTELGTSQSEMGFIDLRRFSREQILAVFDVPPAVAGVFEYANYANAKEQLRYFWYHKLFPMMDDLESVIQTDFLDRFNTGVRVAFKREDVQALIVDYDQKIDAAVKLWGMGLPFDVVNERLDLGFDTEDIEGTDIGYLPFSVQQVGAERLPAPSDAGETPDETDETEPGERSESRRSSVALSFRESDARRRRWLAYMQAIDRSERYMLSAWRGFLEWAGTQAVKDLHDSEQAAFLGLVVHRENQILPDDEEVMNEAKRRVRGPEVAAYRAGRKTAEADLDKNLAFALVDQKIVKALQKRSVYIKSAALAVQKDIRDRVGAGIAAGESVSTIADSILEYIDQSKQGMAQTVARTETLAPFATARIDAFVEAGVREHEWLSARDDDVRTSHLIDRQVRHIGSAFSNGLMYPHDPTAPAEEVINCRCVAIPVVEAA